MQIIALTFSIQFIHKKNNRAKYIYVFKLYSIMSDIRSYTKFNLKGEYYVWMDYRNHEQIWTIRYLFTNNHWKHISTNTIGSYINLWRFMTTPVDSTITIWGVIIVSTLGSVVGAIIYGIGLLLSAERLGAILDGKIGKLLGFKKMMYLRPVIGLIKR